MSSSVLVTGASTGLGLETAIYLAERGLKVYASMRDLGRRDELDQAAERRRVQLYLLKLDITKADEIANAVNTIIKSGEIFGLVNNAGVGLRGYFEDLSDEEIRHVFEVNVFGTMAMTRAVLPHMRAAGRGRIVVISSVGGLISSLAVSAYCATKFAQEGWAESLYQELLPLGIHVSLVEPAIIKTERWASRRGIAKKAQDPSSPYYDWFQASERMANHFVQNSPTRPVDVAKTVHKALLARRPKLRYMAGRRAGLVVKLRKFLPGEIFERFYFGEAIRRVTQAEN